MTKRLYRLKDEGPNFWRIYYGNTEVGFVSKRLDFFRAVIAKIEVHAATKDDAFQQVIAKHIGQDISSIVKNSGDFLRMKKVQAHTQTILIWLRDNCRDGKLSFTNTDLAKALGKKKPDRPLGNLISRLDFACYKAGLPALGCAAEETFKDAWQEREGRDWNFPVEQMRRVAKAHRWSSGDFERVLRETQLLTTGMGHLAWKDEHVKHDARIKEWADKNFPG
jgi:hypothetical protein